MLQRPCILSEKRFSPLTDRDSKGLKRDAQKQVVNKSAPQNQAKKTLKIPYCEKTMGNEG